MRGRTERFSVADVFVAFGLVAATFAALNAQQPGPAPDAGREGVAGESIEVVATRERFAQAFSVTIKNFLETNCLECHDDQLISGELNLAKFATLDDVASSFEKWEKILERIESGEMPPEEAGRIPSQIERQPIVDWIRDFRRFEASRNSGDPGRVLARRLNSAEYNYTIRDLVGFDLQPAKEFPVDPANEAGFDNTGESLSVTPALLTKYLSAARFVSEHLVLKPQGFDFAPHPVVTDTDRDKYAVNRIIAFYKRQNTDLAAYFGAAWRFKHRAALGQPEATLDSTALANHVSAKYLKTVWAALEERRESIGPLAKVQAMWSELPPPNGDEAALQRGLESMRDFVVDLRDKTAVRFENLTVRGMHSGSQPLVMWRNRQQAIHRTRFDPKRIRFADEEPAPLPGAASDGDQRGDRGNRRGGRGRAQRGMAEIANDPNLIIPAGADRAEYEAAFARFAAVFPDKFYVSERGREFLGLGQSRQESGRLLSAGFHSMMGYFRDDVPLVEMLLTADEQAELDALWKELDFITSAPMRQHKNHVWFERTDSRFMLSEEFAFARAEDNDVTSEEKIKRLSEAYVAKATASGASETALEAIADHFENINKAVRWVESARLAAEPSHLEALVKFAARAYRRPLRDEEKADLLNFYRSLREDDGLNHEDALRDAVASVLMSPHFLMRIDSVPAEDGIHPLDDFALASRLSYFLWSSMPDEKLLNRAAAGELRRPDVLAKEAQRMIQDERIRGMAVEFSGNWLEFRRFEEHNAVDRDKFPSFDNALRQAMFEEPIRLFVDVVQRNRSILDFLYAEDTIVNGTLARHYGLPGAEKLGDDWVRVAGAGDVERGGLLPMAVFLTKNAPGLRTSPVKRGYWVVRRILGEEISPPPPNVPELPSEEAALGELTLREVLAKHREDPSCAGCHAKFDSFGLAFEGFGPIGERRTVDLGGRPVETVATFPSGDEGSGLAGLKKYIRAHRQQDFVDNFNRKLLSYALGRNLMPSDDSLLGEMAADLAAGENSFQVLVARIVTSKQFMNRRGGARLASDARAANK